MIGANTSTLELSLTMTHDSLASTSDNSTITAVSADMPIWCKVFIVVYTGILLLPTVLGNFLTVSILRKLRQRSFTDMFVMFMSGIHLVAAIINFPIEIYLMMKQGADDSSIGLCKTYAFMLSLSYSFSWLTFLVMGVERYLTICRNKMNTALNNRPYLVIFVIMCFAIVGSVKRLSINDVGSGGLCRPWSLSLFYRYTSTVFVFIATFLALALCVVYARIVRFIALAAKVTPSIFTVDKQVGANLHRRRLLASSKLLIVITVLFICLTVIPLFFVKLSFLIGIENSKVGRVTMLFLIKLHYLDMCINPFMYFKMNSKFRGMIKWMFTSKREKATHSHRCI